MTRTAPDAESALRRRTAAFAREAMQWERRTLGLGRHVPFAARQQVRRLLGIVPVQEGRRYHRGPLPELFAELARREVRHVVLRWFDALPERPEGDVDLLIADDDCAAVEALLAPAPPGTACDLFDVSGRRGYRYARGAYLPPALARQVLARSVLHRGLVRVPCPADHFASLAYHAVYQKGFAAGIASEHPDAAPAPAPAHDYAGTLAGLARALDLTVAIRLEALEAWLAGEGWRPDPASLRRLAASNCWLARHLPASKGPPHG